MRLLGVQHLLVTNAGGGLNPAFNVGKSSTYVKFTYDL